MSDQVEQCIICGMPIVMQIFKGTAVDCEDCRKKFSNEIVTIEPVWAEEAN